MQDFFLPKEETNKEDDKNTINTKDDTKTAATLEEKYDQLQKSLEKEDGYVVDDQLSYKEDEANGLKYSQCIEKNTKIFYNKCIDKIICPLLACKSAQLK